MGKVFVQSVAVSPPRQGLSRTTNSWAVALQTLVYLKNISLKLVRLLKKKGTPSAKWDLF